jgi:hypothetical protein
VFDPSGEGDGRAADGSKQNRESHGEKTDHGRGRPTAAGEERPTVVKHELRVVTSQDVRLEIERTQKCALHSCIENLGNFRAFK